MTIYETIKQHTYALDRFKWFPEGKILALSIHDMFLTKSDWGMDATNPLSPDAIGILNTENENLVVFKKTYHNSVGWKYIWDQYHSMNDIRSYIDKESLVKVNVVILKAPLSAWEQRLNEVKRDSSEAQRMVG